MMKVFKKTYRDRLSDELLAQWIVSEHLERFKDATVAEVAEAYVGVYSTRPTSWLAVLARNRSLDQTTVISMETASDLVRIPGMRRSKFLLPQSLATMVFGATRLPLVDHEWRLRNVGLKLADFRRILPDILELTKDTPVRLQDIKDVFKLTGPQASACTTVATYDGTLIRTAPSNPWSNRWLYAAAPDRLLPSDDISLDRERLQRDIASRYIEHYGPVSVDDLAWWLAVSKKTARSLLEVSEVYEIVPGMWVSASRKDRFERHISRTDQHPATSVWFLPAWDPLLMGYAPGSRQRDCLGLDLIGGYDASGNGRPVALIGGRAVTTWRIVQSGAKRCLRLDLAHVSSEEETVLQEAALAWANQIGVLYELETDVEKHTVKKRRIMRC